MNRLMPVIAVTAIITAVITTALLNSVSLPSTASVSCTELQGAERGECIKNAMAVCKTIADSEERKACMKENNLPKPAGQGIKPPSQLKNSNTLRSASAGSVASLPASPCTGMTLEEGKTCLATEAEKCKTENTESSVIGKCFRKVNEWRKQLIREQKE